MDQKNGFFHQYFTFFNIDNSYGLDIFLTKQSYKDREPSSPQCLC